MTKLSKNLRELLESVRDYAGTSGHNPGYYTETGRYKPWHNKTVKALVDRGLVLALELEEWGPNRGMIRGAKLDGYLADSKVFFLNLTEAGKKLFGKEEGK